MGKSVRLQVKAMIKGAKTEGWEGIIQGNVGRACLHAA